MISVIIPTYNEEATIQKIIEQLQKNDEEKLVSQIIISDGGSTDNTIFISKQTNAEVILSPAKGRAAQMNYGASFSSNNILYFLNADSIPPPGFSTDIVSAVEKGFASGCFRLSFDYDHWFLKANCWFTRFDINAVRFGGQSLFVTKEIFEKPGGFCEDLFMMEGQEIIKRIKKYGKFKVMNGGNYLGKKIPG